MSNLQFGTLKYLLEHAVTMDELRLYNLTTLGSLIVRGWVERSGSRIRATEAGVAAYMAYHRGTPNYRQHEAELSDRVRGLLHMSRLQAVAKAG